MNSFASRRRRLAVTGISVAALVLMGCGNGDGGAEGGGAGGDAQGIEPRTLLYASFVSETDPYSQAMLATMDEITERSDGAITFEPYWDGSLCATNDIDPCVTDGRTDIGLSSVTFHPAEFPLSNICGVPAQTEDRVAVAAAMQQLYADDGPITQEYTDNNQHVLWFGPASAALLTTQEPLTRFEDLEGLRVRAVGGQQTAMAAAGAAPVAVASAEIYESMQRGVIDGGVNNVNVITGFRLYEVNKYVYDVVPFMGVANCVHHSMNLDTWESLEPAAQDILTEEFESLGENYVADWLAPSDIEDCAEVAAAVESIETLPLNDEAEQISADLRESLMDDWIATAEESGLDDAAGLADTYRGYLEEFGGGGAPGVGEACIEAAASN